MNLRARRLCADDDVWRELCVRNFGIHPSAAPRHRSDPDPDPDTDTEEGSTWRSLYLMHHQVLYSLFRRSGGGGSGAMGGAGVRDAMGAGLGAIAAGRLGGVSISLGA